MSLTPTTFCRRRNDALEVSGLSKKGVAIGPWVSRFKKPIQSMYDIFTYVYLPTFYYRKIGKYTIHGCYGKLSSAMLVGKDVSEAIETSLNKFE